ncbi:hypothetical protein [Pandoraea apista]|uniref:hypothetical protein n=1 Tax=Pandoraea apista TaxID=93218 RepID=UPI002F91E2A8
MKRCSTCGVEKPFIDFPADKRDKTGVGCYCKACRSAYHKQWYQKNRDRHLAQGKQNRIRNIEKRKSYERLWYEQNRERALSVGRAYRAANQEIVREKDRARYSRDPEKYLAYSRKREAAQRRRMPKWYGEFDQFVFEEAHDLCKRRQAVTSIEWHVDHMFPLRSTRVSGLHVGLNAQVIPAAINLSKGNKMLYTSPGEWAKDI